VRLGRRHRPSPAVASGSRASSSARPWQWPPGERSATSARLRWSRAPSKRGNQRTASASTWCSRRPPGTGSIRRSATSARGGCCVPAGTSPSGSAAHVFPDGGDPFFAEIQDVFEEIGEGLPKGASRPRPGELPDARDEIERSGLFEELIIRHVDWEVVYTAEGYLRLLDTFTGHIAMQAWQRDGLYSENPPPARAAAGRAPAPALGRSPSRGPPHRPRAGLVSGSARATPCAKEVCRLSAAVRCPKPLGGLNLGGVGLRSHRAPASYPVTLERAGASKRVP
jgi:hypothetical protein